MFFEVKQAVFERVYGYVLNNPLIYIDPSGEIFKEVGRWIKKHSKEITFVVTVVVAVVATVATAGMASPILAGVIVGGAAGFTAGAVGTWTSGGSFGDGLVNGLFQGTIGAVAGGIGAGVGAWASQHIGGVVVNGLNVAGPAVKGMVGGVIGGGFGGFAGGTATGLLAGESFGDALSLGAKGAMFGAAVGGLVGTAQGIKYAKANNLDAWSGKSNIQFGKGTNQVSHTFRHTDQLGLDRSNVQSSIESHLNNVAPKITPGRPHNFIINVGGQNIQYTAYKLPDGTINIGRIHGIN